MAKPKPLHVTWRKDKEDWAVIRKGAKRAVSRHDTKTEAVAAGKEAATAQACKLVVENQDGSVSEERDYSD